MIAVNWGDNYAYATVHSLNRKGLIVAPLRFLAARYRSVVVSSTYSLLLRIGGAVVTFGLGVTLARVLGPANYGIYGLITTLVALSVTVSLVGTLQLAVREISVRRARNDWPGVKGVIFEFNRATALAAVAIGMAATAIAIAIHGFGEIAIYSLQAALLTLALAITAGIASQLRGLGALFKGQFLDIFGRPAVTFVFTLGLVLAGSGLTVARALWIQVAVAIVAAWISFFWIRKAIPAAQRSTTRTRNIPWLGAAVPLGIVDTMRQFDGAYGVILMGWLASDAELGVFRVAVACGVLASMPLTVLHVVLAPTVSRLYDGDRKPELQTLLSATSLALVLALAPITLASWLIGRPAIELVFGPAYGDAWLPLFLLCAAQQCSALFGMGPILLAMCRGERQLIKIYAIAQVVGIIAAIPLIHAYGAPGAAAAPIVTMAIIGSLSWRYARKVMGVDITFLPLVRRAVRR